MSDYGPETPLRQPSSPPVRKKSPFSGFRSPKYAILTPLFPKKSPKITRFAPISAPLVSDKLTVFIPLAKCQLPLLSGH